MKTNKVFKLAVFASAVAFGLSACGGGGGGNNSAPASQPAPPSTPVTSIAPKTTVPAPTYDPTSTQATAFATLNAYRLAMGVGQVAQDPVLDSSAQAHALYVESNLATGKLSTLSHDEASNLANFYSETPLSRAQKAGAPATEWIAEAIGAGFSQASAADYGNDCVSGLLNSVYHLQGITSNQETMGIGFQQSSGSYTNYNCVLDFGETTGVVGTPQANSIYLGGGQQLSTTTIAHAPLGNEVNVQIAMRAESPNPASDLATPGRPVMVRVNAAAAGDVLTVSSFTLTASNGTAVAARIIVPAEALTGSAAGVTSDANNALFQGVAFLLPLTPLAPNTAYTASFAGARNGTPISVSWSFTTGSK